MIDKVIIDLDGTTWNLIKCITDLYNEDFKYYSKFKPIDWEDVKTWDFKELELASPEYVNYYFNQPRFFKKIQLMENAKAVIGWLSERFEIVFCSLCYSPNGKGKEKWIKENFPYAKFINVNMKEYQNKNHIDMSNAIFLDDSENNLDGSNAPIKVCFGRLYPWNESWDGDRCDNWLDFKQYIENLDSAGYLNKEGKDECYENEN